MLSVDFKHANRRVLEAAVQALGFSIQGGVVTTPRGSFRLEGDRAQAAGYLVGEVNALRVQYSKEALKYAAARSGWQKVTVGANKFKLSKGV